MKCNYNSKSGRVPSSLEAIGMFKAILMAQNNGNFHKTWRWVFIQRQFQN